MKKKAKRAVSKSMLRRYLAILLAVITVITTIPLSNITLAKAGVKDKTFYFTFDPSGSDSYIADTWVFWDGDLTGIAEQEDYSSVCQSAWLLIATWDTAQEAYEESKDISWTKLSNNYYMADGDFYNATPFIRIIIDTPSGYHLKSVRDANDSKMAYYYDGGNTVVAECGLYIGDWTEVGNAEDRKDESESNITLEWERDTYSMTMSWDSGVDYVTVNNYSSDYNYTTAGQSHDFGTGDTITTNVHLKSGYNMVGFQEGSKLWTDFSPKTKYQSEYSGSWTMNGNRSTKVITETTLSFEYDSGFENSAHIETVRTDTYYKDYPKLKKNYVIDYIEELGTDNKWYTYDGKDSNGSYTNWSAYKPRKIKYHSKIKDSAKNTINFNQGNPTTKGTERITVLNNEDLPSITVPKKEYTATFYDGDTKVHPDIIDRWKFKGYYSQSNVYTWNYGNMYTFSHEYARVNESSSDDAIYIGNGFSADLIDSDCNMGADGWYFDLYTTNNAGSKEITFTHKYAESFPYFGYIRLSLSTNGVYTGARVYYSIDGDDVEDEYGNSISSGWHQIYNGYSAGEVIEYIYVSNIDTLRLKIEKDSGDGGKNLELYVQSVDKAVSRGEYWYDENGNGLITCPDGLGTHTLIADWENECPEMPDAPVKANNTFVGWRDSEEDFAIANWANDDSDYQDCKEEFNGDVFKWFQASRNEEDNVSDWAVNKYLVPNSYYLNDEVIHFSYYDVSYAGNGIDINKDTKFIACYDEQPKVLLRTLLSQGITNTYIDNESYLNGKKVYTWSTHSIRANIKTGYTFDGWYERNTKISSSNNTSITVDNNNKDITAKATPNKYTITYNLNGGTHGSSHPASATYDKAFTISNPTRTGYEFTGWTITGTDNSTKVINGTSYKNLTPVDGATVTFTANWNRLDFNVSFSPNGGTGSMNAVTATYGLPFTIPASSFSRYGYTQTGWTTKSDGTGDAYNLGQTINPFSYRNDLTLYAKWQINRHNIKVYIQHENADGTWGTPQIWIDKTKNYNESYHYDGYGSDSTGPDNAVYRNICVSGTMPDDDVSKTVKAYRRTYTQKLTVYYENIDGTWSAGQTVINEAYRYGQTVSWSRVADVRYEAANISWTVEGNNSKDIYVHRRQYKLTVNGNAHITGTQGSGTYRYEHIQWIEAQIEVGYHFLNWNGDSSLTQNGMNVTVTGDATYTANAAPNTDTPYTVEHYQMNLDGTTYTLAETDKLKGTTDTKVTPNVKTYTGFTSPSTQTVNINGDGSTVVKYYYSRNKYTLNLDGIITGTSRGNLTEEVDGITFTAGTATVTINGNTTANLTDFYQQVYYGSSYEITVTANTGYTVKAGYFKGTMSADNQSCVAVIDANEYRIYFKGNTNASSVSTIKLPVTVTVKYNRKAYYDNASMNGYTFTGWYRESDCTNAYSSGTRYQIASDITLYAKWSANRYTITFDSNKPELAIHEPSTAVSKAVIFDSVIGTLPVVALQGYRFDGWYTAREGGTKVEATQIYDYAFSNATDKTLFAHWTDEAPTGLSISVTTNADTKQTVTLNAKDIGSGVSKYYWGINSNPSVSDYKEVGFNNSTGAMETVAITVDTKGTYYFYVLDRTGNKTGYEPQVFVRTDLDSNYDYIYGIKDISYSSKPKISLSYIISRQNDSINLDRLASRSGCNYLGFNTDASSKTAAKAFTASVANDRLYAIWQDIYRPLVVITDVSNNDSNMQTIKFNLYDLDGNYDENIKGNNFYSFIENHGKNTGSDIVAYWFGTNTIYNGEGNKRIPTRKNSYGYSVDIMRDINIANTYYIFAEDKAGNISNITIALGANGKLDGNTDLTFCSLTLNANDGLLQENGRNTIQKLIRKGNTYNLTNVHAERTGYHDTESGTDGASNHWSHSATLGENVINDDQTITGTNNDNNKERIDEWTAEGNDTLYAKWTPNAYTLKVYLNKPVKATEDINTYNTVSSDTNKWVYDTYTGYYKTVLVYDKVWSIPDSTEFAGLTGWTTTGFKNVGETKKSDTAYLNSLNRSYDEADDISKVSDVGTNLTSVKDDTVAYTMLWKENKYTVNFRANGGTAVKRVTLLEKKISGEANPQKVVDISKATSDKTYDTSIIIGYESMINVLDSPVRPGFAFTFFTKDKDYAKTAHMKDDKPDFSKSVLCTGELSEEAAKKYREEYKITGSLNGNEEVDLYSSWSKRKPVTLQSFVSANSIRTDANALTKTALGTYITRDNAKDISSAWFNKNYKTNDKGEYVMNDTVEVLQEWNVTKTEIKQTYSKKIMADNN